MRRQITNVVVGLLLVLLGTASITIGDTPNNPPTSQASTPPAIDWDKARQLHDKEVRHEPLTADEQAYLDQAKAAMRSGHGPGQPGGGGAVKPLDPPRESTGLVPLTDLKDKYKGQDGGLYGGGSNEIPEAQKKAALAAAAKVVPLDADGKPADDGKIVLLSIGMSNTTMEFSRFKQIADQDAGKNPRLVVVDGAQGGKDAASWVNSNGKGNVWQLADKRIQTAGATQAQVQVVWLKQALIGPSRLGEFPKHADVLRDDLIAILKLAKQHYPNLKLAYLSSRIYAGYATTPLNPEPYSYESAFAVRAVIQMQMKKEAGLGVADGNIPVVLWGPYLWTDGTAGRKCDDVVWNKEDIGQDGTHPSASGQKKVADMLQKFFTTDATTTGWYMAKDAGK